MPETVCQMPDCSIRICLTGDVHMTTLQGRRGGPGAGLFRGLDGAVPCGGGLWSGLYSSGVNSLPGRESTSVGLSRIYLWVMSAFYFLSNLII